MMSSETYDICLGMKSTAPRSRASRVAWAPSEVKEETMLDCTDAKFLFYMDNLPTKEYNTHFLTFFFLCEWAGKVNINRESAEFHWISSDELSSYKLAFLHDEAILKFKDMS